MKRILLVPDVAGWAWWRRACGIANNAPAEFSVDVVPQASVKPGTFETYDAVLIFEHDAPRQDRRGSGYLWTFAASEGVIHPYKRGQVPRSHRARLGSKNRNSTLARSAYKRFDGVININPWIQNKLARMTSTPVRYLDTGVDTELFYPQTIPRSTGKLRAGWCGKLPTTRWTPKGFDEVLKPLMESTSEWIEWNIAGCHPDTARDAHGMRDWYNEIDVFVCTSCCEGTPSTALEAAACGRHVIMTRVGICDTLDAEGIAVIAGQWDTTKQSIQCVKDFRVALRQFDQFRQTTDMEIASRLVRAKTDTKLSWKAKAQEWCERLTRSPQSP